MLSILIGIPTEYLEKVSEEIIQRAEESIEKLATMTHGHIVERASQELNSNREEFIKSLKLEQLDDGIWEISIPQNMMWIEKGLPAGFDMLPGLLASPSAKTGKNGKYVIVPFKHDKGSKSPVQQVLAAQLKQEMQKRNIPRGIERDSKGDPKLGLLHKFNVDTPVKESGFPLLPASKESGKPYLHGVRIYQREIQNAQGKKEIKKDILTFRTASEKHQGKLWIHPGIEAKNFLDEAKTWAEDQWEKIVLDLFKNLGI